MKRLLIWLLLFVSTFAFAQAPLRAVTTFSLLGDIVTEIGGAHVEVHSMVPMGTDPHEYQPLPADVIKATQADVLFWNGLDMETGDGWFRNLVNVAGKAFNTPQVVELAAGIEPLYLTDGETHAVNPHAFISPRQGIVYAQNVVDALVHLDPSNVAAYQENAEAYIKELQAWDNRYAAAFAAIPESERNLVTSERAFQYLARDYGITEGYLWEIDTDEQGTPRQIASLIEFIRTHEVHGLLVETNVDPRPLRTVASETGVPIVGKVYSDELGPAGSPGETYLSYLEFNLQQMLLAMGR